MRLLPLRDNCSKLDQFHSLWMDYLNETDIEQETQASPNEYFLFEYDNMPVGFAIANLEEECFPDEDMPESCLHVSAFYIKPEHRGHHFGKKAFKLLRQWGRDNKAALIEIEADSENAKQFIMKQGLDYIGKGKHYLYRGFI